MNYPKEQVPTLDQQEQVPSLKDTRPIRVRRAMNVGPAAPTAQPKAYVGPASPPESQSTSAEDGPTMRNENLQNGSQNEIHRPGLSKEEPIVQSKSDPEKQSESSLRSTLTWRDYSDWRKSKCPQPEFRAPIWLDELDQAIHEFIGECAELSACVQDVGPWMLVEGHHAPAKVLDEIGDVVFTGCWVLDCLDESFLAKRGEIARGFLSGDQRMEVYRSHNAVIDMMKPEYIEKFDQQPDPTKSAIVNWYADIRFAALQLLTHAGMLSNRFKKIRWQRVYSEELTQSQIESMFYAFLALDELCVLSGLELEDAARANMAKLDKRFPDGWKPGGGNR